MKTKVVVLTAALVGIWSLKRYYADASVDDLWWILGPTARLAGTLTGTAFAMAAGEGYFSHDRLFVIEKSCAGINFMIAAFGMVTCALVHRVGSAVSGARVLAVSLLAGYAMAVLVNAVRIAIAVWLAAHPIATLTPAEVHRLEGITVYFGGLTLLYELAQRIDRSMTLTRSGA